MADDMEGRAVVTVRPREGAAIEVVVREATVGELRAYLASLPEPATLLDEALLPDLRVVDLPLFTSLTAEQTEKLRPSQLRKVAAAVAELNPDFFALLQRVRGNPTLETASGTSPNSTTPA